MGMMPGSPSGQEMLGPQGADQMPGPAMPEPQMGQEPQQPSPPPDPQAQIGNYVDSALSDTNLAKKLKDKTDKDGNDVLTCMASELLAGYLSDERSREGWLDRNKDWLNMALLIRENKTYPWPKASNVKYPLIATAAMQFSARAYPALVPQDGQIVKAKVVRKDKQGLFQQKAIRVAVHMSYQIMCKVPNWEEEMDKCLMTMAISGICFKETYHDPLNKVHVSQLVYPENFCINYYAKSIEKAYRKTRILEFTENEIQEKVLNDEMFLDIEYGEPTKVIEAKTPIATGQTVPDLDDATPHRFFAIHTYWDLDEDGYEEPYIVTIHEGTSKVVRIIARWDSDGVIKNDKGKILYIKPVEYFTAFPFIPNADGSIYACGFGMLLGPLNESINTNINQLTDAGTMANMSGGFVSKNLRMKMGQTIVAPGKWTAVNATGDDLKNGFFPIPVKDPSPVLMTLLQMLTTAGNQLASIAEIMVGKMPGQNTPATTTQETVQQSMAVFTAIYKRVYRSLASEFKKFYRLNRITPGILEEESAYVDEPLTVSDYEGTEDFIVPGADPTGDSSAQRAAKMSGVMQMIQLGTIDPMAATVRMLEAQEVPNYQQLIAKPQPPKPDPKAQESQAKIALLQQKGQIDEKKGQMDMQLAQQQLQLAEQKAQIEAQGQSQKLNHEQQLQALKLQGEQQSQKMDMIMQVIESQFKQKELANNVQANAITNQQGIVHAEQNQQQALRHTEQSHAQQTVHSEVAGAQKIHQGAQESKQKIETQKQLAKAKPKPAKAG